MPNLYDSDIELSHSDFQGGDLRSPKPGLYLFYADWCPHCNNPDFMETWREVHSELRGERAVRALNCADAKNREVCQNVGVSGFPTIMRMSSSGHFEPYEGPREKDALIAAAKGQSGGARRRSRRSSHRSRSSRRSRSRRSRRRSSRRSRRRSSHRSRSSRRSSRRRSRSRRSSRRSRSRRSRSSRRSSHRSRSSRRRSRSRRSKRR